MNKKSIALLVGMSLLVPFAAYAAQFRSGEQAMFSSGESAPGNLYLAGGTVSSSGTVKGDLVAAGGTIVVTGPVSNDLLVGGGNITEISDVGGDARIAGGNVHAQGKIGGDLLMAGGQATVEGSVGGDVAIAGGSVTIDAPIAGNVQVYAGTLTLGPQAVINGDLTYSASKEATMESGAVVHGKINFTQHTVSTTQESPEAFLGAFLTFWLFARLLMLLLGAFVFFFVFPRYAHKLSVSFAQRPLQNLGRGFLAIVALPVGGVLLLATIVGIPLGALALLSFAALMIFASLIAPVAVGSVVHKWIWKPETYQVNWKTILLGVAIYFVLGLIPVLGWIVRAVVLLMVVGVAVQVKWSAAQDWR